MGSPLNPTVPDNKPDYTSIFCPVFLVGNKAMAQQSSLPDKRWILNFSYKTMMKFLANNHKIKVL